jgi:multidrug resistance protein, MATE family
MRGAAPLRESRFAGLWREFPPMLRLAAPLALAELGWVAMGVVDTVMVGRLGAAAIGGVSLGSILFLTVEVAGLGLVLGLDTLVSQAFGAGDLPECHRSLVASLYLVLMIAPIQMALLWGFLPLMDRFGIHPLVQEQTVPFMQAIVWSAFPQMLYFALRRYVQGMNLVHAITFSLITANLVNAGFNWILIFGNLGAPAMGVAGSGYATLAARIYMAAVLAVYIIRHDRRHGTGLFRISFAFDGRRIRRLTALGAPVAAQLSLEVGVFAAVTALIGTSTPAILAAHQIALHAVSTTFMVPLGISSAAAVRVGQALGRGDPEAASRAGSAALLLGAGFMVSAGMVFVFAPRSLIRIFTLDPAVTATGVTLLAIAALFQLFDGVQIVATGALRGAGDTRTPMLCHLGAYWGIGLPLGYWLCFYRGWQVAGLWTGLCVALILIGMALLTVWRRTIRVLAQEA